MSETPPALQKSKKRLRKFPWGFCVFLLVFLWLTKPRFDSPSGLYQKFSVKSSSEAIRNAIISFKNDYGHLPQSPTAPKDKDFDTDTSPASGMIALLKGMDVAGNPRETDYLAACRT